MSVSYYVAISKSARSIAVNLLQSLQSAFETSTLLRERPEGIFFFTFALATI